MTTQTTLTKTEQALLDKLATKRSGIMAVETLADGTRKYEAAKHLVEKGLVTLVRADRDYIPVRKGQGRNAHWATVQTHCLVIAHAEAGQGQA